MLSSSRRFLGFVFQIEADGAVNEERESRLFPDPEQSDSVITCHVLTPEFLIFGTQVKISQAATSTGGAERLFSEVLMFWHALGFNSIQEEKGRKHSIKTKQKVDKISQIFGS
jgi:hypothetical protein